MGAGCALRRYPQQPTGAGPPGAREESAPKTATADVSLPFCKKRIEKGKGVGGGSSATHETAKTGVYETAPGKTRPSLREGWSQLRLREPDTERKLRMSYPWWNLEGLEVSKVEWSWRRRQEVTGVATRRGVREERRGRSAATRAQRVTETAKEET